MHILNIQVHVFCHMACKNGYPPEFKHNNDRIFRSQNMQTILDMLEGKPNTKPWNNIHNELIHMMLKWDKDEFRQFICPALDSNQFSKLTPKEIGAHLEVWFSSWILQALNQRRSLKES